METKVNNQHTPTATVLFMCLYSRWIDSAREQTVHVGLREMVIRSAQLWLLEGWCPLFRKSTSRIGRSRKDGWLRWWRICLQCRTPGFDPWIGNIPWRREWLPTPVFLSGEFHEQRSLVGNSPWDRKESDMTERVTLPLNSITMRGTLNLEPI